jgi:Pentapeptide repeats (9 copies)
MNWDETVALFLECEAKRLEAHAAALAEGKSKYEAEELAHEAAKAPWNAWAGALLAKRKAMEADGSWALQKNWFGDIEAGNSATEAWMDEASADFSHVRFEPPAAADAKEAPERQEEEAGQPYKLIETAGETADFQGFVFPGATYFRNTIFSGTAEFTNAVFPAEVHFPDAAFTSPANFDNATFTGDADFASATFSAAANFNGTAFVSDVVFGNATFLRTANFEGAIFSGEAGFGNASFTRGAYFQDAMFRGDADFETAAFSGAGCFQNAAFSACAHFEHANFEGSAWFTNASFARTTRFQHAWFRQKVDFAGITSQHSFALTGAHFLRRVPDFQTARFSGPVAVDGIRFGAAAAPGGLLLSALGGSFLLADGEPDAELSMKYRVLKRLAALGGDPASERSFFQSEMRARRYREDKPWHPAFWLGIACELFSSFGHSVFRPIFWLAALTLVSGWFYLAQHKGAELSLRAEFQGRIVPLLPDRLQAPLPAPQPQPPLACKHGDGSPAAAAALLAIRQGSVLGILDTTRSAQIYGCLYGLDADGKTPGAPDAVMFWGIAQTVLSAALWCLLLLGLRNQFRIR